MATKDIYLEMLKEWGGFQVGDIVRFGRTKGERMIENGIGRKVKKQREVNRPETPAKRPRSENAMATPQAEIAVVTPEAESKPLPPAKDTAVNDSPKADTGAAVGKKE